ncbi:MAG: sigma-70 family RNA polymerase sigma factor, partial [Bacteroidaceae bacterium]|nr:sigma-70 family RNA polymerase sigma factor [Bacteroidaceae bacterium]
YAVWWIRQSILQALAEQSRLVRIPSNQVGIMSKVNQFIHQYVQTHEHRPTIGEICDALELDPERVQNAIESYGHHISVDAPLVDDDQSSLLDVLSGNEADTEEKNLIYESLANELERSLATLPDRERTIVKMFFGIGYSEKSLEEIGEEIGLSRERVRQIKEKALRQLRESSNTPVLRSYLG